MIVKFSWSRAFYGELKTDNCLKNEIIKLGNVVLMSTDPERDLVISHQTRNLIYY